MNDDETQDAMKQSLAGFSFANNKLFYISSLALFGLWLVFCWQGLTTVVEIWYGNEIFNHGFFIVPGAFYLIYLKRFELLSKPIQTSPLALIIIIPALLLYVIGVAGDIQLFLHAATFTLLPALIWLVIGTQAAKTILFPLIFMLFSIPVGEQLIPYLQEIAADGSVALLRLTGVPLFRSGLYIEIPQGRFLVAEACSGVSFFIASFVIGSLYAYLNLASVKRRAAFVIISLIFPILANIVRVYGIILIAYWTDMEHAAGADHLIYGWFFFAFVIVCLLGIGELMRQQVEAQIVAQKDGVPRNVNIATVAVSVIAIVVSFVWQRAILDQDTLLSPPSSTSLSSMNNESCPRISWEPIIVKPDTLDEAYVQGFDCNVKAYTAWFSEKDNELVSDLHRLFDPERFSLEGTEQIEVKNLTFTVYHIVSTQGERLSLVRWYRIDGKNYVSTIKAKIHQLKNKLGNQHKGGRMWVLGIDDADLDNINSVLEKAVGQ
ncbi:transmembrane protein EpsH [Alteromonas macleodii str. 'Balearic Sea AD45']|mgnify:FL=1|uniref:exosortase A n=1 Tax=Alteromonas macleodii TaxID=28108 RepID=UPI000286FE75|nr:exosortase A [Alteromonas macleodii]AFT96214.1 transmembrane protein EpsH [Alteromonas macleodii str. 'Balearic Sea AD45']